MPLFSRPLRRRLASLMALVILAVQMATAAYACDAAFKAQLPADEMAAMQGCMENMSAPKGMTDTDNPGLCKAHCSADATASSEQAGGALQLPASAPLLYIAWTFFFAVPLRGRRLPRAPKTERATPPPLSILHCCYRV